MSAIGQDPAGSPAPATTQTTEPGTTAAPETAAPQTSTFDYDRIESMLDQRFEAQDQRIGGLEQRLPQPEPEPQPDPMQGLNGLQDMGYDPAEIQQLQGVLSPLLQAAVQQATGPLQQTIQQLQQNYAALNNELDAGDLVEKYPALGTDEVWNPVGADAVQLAQSLGLQVQHPEEVPAALVEQVYLARLGRERVASETPAPGPNPGLESGRGATPPEPEPDLASEIVAARGGQRTNASNFWGWTS